MSMMVSFVLSFFPRDVLDEILNLIESVSEDFPSYSYPKVRKGLLFAKRTPFREKDLIFTKRTQETGIRLFLLTTLLR